MTEFIIKFHIDQNNQFLTTSGGDMTIPHILAGLEMLKKNLLDQLTTQHPQLVFPKGNTGKIDFPAFRPKNLP